jgi:hypothetical protein
MPTSINKNTEIKALSSSDSKVLVRHVLSDRIEFEHNMPLLPSTAEVVGDAKGPHKNWTGVYAHSERSIGLYAVSPVYAGWFDGDVQIIGDLTQESGAANFANVAVSGDIMMVNADCAEDFDISGADEVEPGTVMVLGNEGSLFQSQEAYDKRVAGVISGAGDFKPGIVLDKQQTSGNRQPVALMGKVFCKVDAQYGAIEVGDLLTTSPTPGHAMPTSDPFKAFGAVIGKALRSFRDGQGLIPILIALQ